MSSKLARPSLEEASALVDEVVAHFTARKKSGKCSDVTSRLQGLGFTITPGKCDGHKIVSHKGLEEFSTSSYNCEHGKNGDVSLPYMVKLIKVLRDNKISLAEYLKEAK